MDKQTTISTRTAHYMASTTASSSNSSSPKQHKSQRGTRWRFIQFTKDFQYGAKYVHFNYLPLFWKYSIQQAFLWTLPLLAIVTLEHVLPSTTVGSLLVPGLNQLLQYTFVLASVVGRLLNAPLEICQHCLVPAGRVVVIPVLNSLPATMAIPLVGTLLQWQGILHGMSQSYFFSFLAALLWRPVVEEFQYRYLLLRLLTRNKKQQQQQLPTSNTNDQSQSTLNDESSSSMVQFLPIDGNDNSRSNNQNVTTTTTTTTTSIKTNNNRSSAWELQKSRRVWLSCALFAATRLGWAYAAATSTSVPPSPPSYDTMGISPIRSLQALVSSASTTTTSLSSPYAWTVGFVQSTMVHLSSSQVKFSSPLFQKGWMVLAMQQAFASFLFARHVLLPLCQTPRGVAASMGAHVAWTIGKVTLPLRLLWKLYHIIHNSKIKNNINIRRKNTTTKNNNNNDQG